MSPSKSLGILETPGAHRERGEKLGQCCECVEDIELNGCHDALTCQGTQKQPSPTHKYVGTYTQCVSASFFATKDVHTRAHTRRQSAR